MPLYFANQNINRPKNFYNYNQSYNQKVMNIFYGIKKSPILSPSRHKRWIPSFSLFNEINIKRAFERHLSQKNIEANINQFDNNINIIDIQSQKDIISAKN